MARSWLGDSKIAIYCIIAMSQWQFTGYITLLMVVAIQNVPNDYIEAASIDGAGPVKTCTPYHTASCKGAASGMLNHHGNRSVQVVYRGIFHHRRRARKQYTGIGGVSLPERIPSR